MLVDGAPAREVGRASRGARVAWRLLANRQPMRDQPAVGMDEPCPANNWLDGRGRKDGTVGEGSVGAGPTASHKIPMETHARGSRCPLLTGPAITTALCLALLLLKPRRALAQGRVEYRYEDYREDGNRMDVQTHTAWFEYALHEKVTARGSFTRDALAGATPTGGPGEPGGPGYEWVNMRDLRNAGFVEASIRAGRTLTTPQVAYSEESDYQSTGLSLTETIDFNQRNTSLVLGLARNSDSVKGRFQRTFRHKGTWDWLVGVNQVLGPRTYATFNVTLGYADGYLSDPYKGVNVFFDLPGDVFDANPWYAVDPEKRPSSKFKQVAFASINHLVPAVNGAVDASYRFHHDNWGVIANTVQVGWAQKLGQRITVAPLFRYHHQTAADFFVARVNSDPAFAGSRVAFDSTNNFAGQEGVDPGFDLALADPANYQIVSIPAYPDHYSADYRLSELQSFTVGVSVAVQVHERATLVLGYRRYDMQGLDPRISAATYPDAHIYSVGLSATF